MGNWKMIGYNGLENLVWFLGYVADGTDLTGQGRVKVRVFGIHPTVSEQTVQDEDLPWAYTLRPNSVMFGEFKIGSMVFGCFLDGRDAQQPLVLGVIGTNKNGVPSVVNNSPQNGFSPEGNNGTSTSNSGDPRTFGTGDCSVTSVAPPASADSISPEYAAMLSTIQAYEAGSGGYAGYYNNAHTLDLNQGHPNYAVPIPNGPNAGRTSSAGGMYQFLGSTWISVNGGNAPMTPANQDAAAIKYAETIAQRHFGINDLQSYLETNGMDDTMISVLGHSSGWEAFRSKKPECFKDIYNGSLKK
jgi:muramidase (phage lysozyme)